MLHGWMLLLLVRESLPARADVCKSLGSFFFSLSPIRFQMERGGNERRPLAGFGSRIPRPAPTDMWGHVAHVSCGKHALGGMWFTCFVVKMNVDM